jgi:hypothetical protein
VDRWHTTDRDGSIARPWFEEHVWPLVDCKASRRAGYMPSGGATWASAHPIARENVPGLLDAWLTAETTWNTRREGNGR